MMTIIVFILCIVIAIIILVDSAVALYKFIISQRNNIETNTTKPVINVSSDITNMFISELDKIILYNTVYNIDVMFGENFSNKKAVTADIENDDLINAVDAIEKDIINNMGDTMKEYLYNVFGRDWIYRYINIQTLSLSLNYTRLNINQLTRKLF